MSGIQEISARIGIVTGRGLAGNLRRHFPRPLLYAVVTLLLVANTINIGADIGAMAASLAMLAGGPTLVYIIAFGVFSAVLQVVIPYHRYVSVLKWLCLTLFAYIGIGFVVRVPWLEVGRATLVPHVAWTKASLTAIVAIFGTTISPYLFFWQASEEVEEQQIDPARHPLKLAPEQAQPSSSAACSRIRGSEWPRRTSSPSSSSSRLPSSSTRTASPTFRPPVRQRRR